MTWSASSWIRSRALTTRHLAGSGVRTHGSLVPRSRSSTLPTGHRLATGWRDRAGTDPPGAMASAGEGGQRDPGAEEQVTRGVGVVAVRAEVGDHLGGVGRV